MGAYLNNSDALASQFQKVQQQGGVPPQALAPFQYSQPPSYGHDLLAYLKNFFAQQPQGTLAPVVAKSIDKRNGQ